VQTKARGKRFSLQKQGARLMNRVYRFLSTKQGLKTFPGLLFLSLGLGLSVFTFNLWAQTPKSITPGAELTGVLVGKLTDAQTGEPLIGATVRLQGTNLGAVSNQEGDFRIKKVPSQIYALVATYIGYAKTTVSEINVKPNEVTDVTLSLRPESIELEEEVVEAKALYNTEGALLKMRRKATAVSDAISAEQMSRSASGDAAEALSQVTGATVQDGKYVLIRGLGERYVTTQLNGSTLPSADPDKKAVQMDLFPTKLLDNVTTIKSFTPDQPGDFSGGIINLQTKSFPEKFTLSFSGSRGYNSNATSSANFLSNHSGSLDWLGMDDGTRAIPDELADPNVDIPTASEAYRNAEKAYELDRLSKAFNAVMAPTAKTGPVNGSYSLSVGTQTGLWGKPLGITGSLSYNRSFTSYTDGTVARYSLTGNVNQTNELSNEFLLNDSKSTDEVLWGGLANLSYSLSPRHELGVNYLYNRGAESMARYLYGAMPLQLSEEDTYETRVLHYTERALGSLQFNGKHHLPGLLGMSIDWSSSFTNSSQDEPDVRYFSDHFTVLQGETSYTIAPYIHPAPSRSFRYLEEDSRDFKLNLSFPFQQWGGLPGKFRIGGLYQTKDRSFRQRSFNYSPGVTTYQGDPEEYFSQVGIIDTSNGRYIFGNNISEVTRPSDNYDGWQDIAAFYSMAEIPVFGKLNFVGGFRYETTKIKVSSLDRTLTEGKLDNKDYLPSINLIYNLGQEINLRGAYGRTLARPSLRELAPYASYEFVRGNIFIGNPNLKRTLIDNYDLRWEWFDRPGEIVAVSGFYKSFDRPIERAILTVGGTGQVMYQNVDQAKVWGMEFEVRKRLDQISSKLANFQLGGNLTLVQSEVKIPTAELVKLKGVDSNVSDKRPLQGQSPYVLNLNLTYDSFRSGSGFGVYYNIFGRRLSEVGAGGTPGIFEKPHADLDLTFSQRILAGFTLKGSVKNALNSDIVKAHTYKGVDYITNQYNTGRTFSLGVNYEL
jgi:TonB-dependent receptor